MSNRFWSPVAALVVGLVLFSSCGGGGGSKKSPFPAAVRNLFGDLDDALRGGAGTLPASLTCGIVNNPFDADVNTNTDQIAGSGDDHEGTVPSVTEQVLEIRNTNGSGTISYTVVDSSDPGRVFVDFTGTLSTPTIKFLPPPLGANEFLAADGTGQVFVVVTIERTIQWTRTFENDPVGTGGTG
ncbi:MAG: hypothetical protein O6952_07405, partial [Planctomycetota bacterium]|nr:hypothetical protein [Planctomycetota bacterium]